MRSIETARGPIDSAALGYTLAHEHLFLLSPGVNENWPQVFDRPAAVRRVVDRLEAVRAAGVETVVDLTTIDLGRDVTLIREVAEQTAVNVVICTGVHLRPSRFLNWTAMDRVAELYRHDIEEGIAGTQIRAAVLKIATAETVTEENERHLRTVARAQRATGVPIITHSEAATESGSEQQRVFEEEGVDLERVVIGHVGDTTDIDYLTRLLERGSYVGLDRFGMDDRLPLDERIAVVVELCRRGHTSKLILSHDATGYFDVEPLDERPLWNYETIPTIVVPRLLEAGVSEQQVHTMMGENPRRLFEGG